MTEQEINNDPFSEVVDLIMAFTSAVTSDDAQKYKWQLLDKLDNIEAGYRELANDNRRLRGLATPSTDTTRINQP